MDTYQKKLNIKDNRMVEYFLDTSCSMANSRTSPISYGRPSYSFWHTIPSSLKNHEPTGMVKEKVTLELEKEEKCILQCLYKREEDELKYVEISPEKYGVGYQFIEKMRHNGKIPLGKGKGLVESLYANFHNPRDTIGVGYHEKKFNPPSINVFLFNTFGDSNNKDEDALQWSYKILLHIPIDQSIEGDITEDLMEELIKEQQPQDSIETRYLH